MDNRNVRDAATEITVAWLQKVNTAIGEDAEKVTEFYLKVYKAINEEDKRTVSE